MKIAHIVCTYPPYYGGMGNVVFQTAEWLSILGHDVEVFTPQYYEGKELRSREAPPIRNHAPELAKQIDTVHRLTPSLSYGNAARMPQLARELDAFDLVHLHYPFFGTANLVRKWKLRHPKKPLVITYHMDTRGPGWKGVVFRYYSGYWMPKILAAADGLITSSFDYIEASDAKAVYEADKKKWLELPFGVDIDRFAPRPAPPRLREALALDPARSTLLFVGGMDHAHDFKGIPIFLSALYIALRSGFAIQTVLVGDGELRPEFEARADALGIGKYVRFVGAVEDDELPAFYNLADLFVLPSIHRGEAFGMVLLEAMASGVPLLATDLPGVRTVVKDVGVVVKPNDAKELADTIMDFVKTNHYGDTLRHQVRLKAEEQYAWQPIVTKLTRFYETLVS